MSRLAIGTVLPRLELPTLSHGTLTLPNGRLTHLQFRRFAGCPICNLHLREFARSIDRLTAAGVQLVAFVHSSAKTMQRFQGDLPFPVVPDLERTWYTRFGVERSLASWLHPVAQWRGAKGMVLVPSKAFVGEGGHDGLPADFLLDGENRLLACRYAAHAADDWSVDDLFREVDKVRSLAAPRNGES